MRVLNYILGILYIIVGLTVWRFTYQWCGDLAFGLCLFGLCAFIIGVIAFLYGCGFIKEI